MRPSVDATNMGAVYIQFYQVCIIVEEINLYIYSYKEIIT